MILEAIYSNMFVVNYNLIRIITNLRDDDTFLTFFIPFSR